MEKLKPRPSTLNLINDSCWWKATIAPRKGMHDGAIIVFRPVDYICRKSKQMQLLELQSERKYEQVATEEAVGTIERIQDWDLELSTEDIKRNPRLVNVTLFKDIYDVVWGFEAPLELERVEKN